MRLCWFIPSLAYHFAIIGVYGFPPTVTQRLVLRHSCDFLPTLANINTAPLCVRPKYTNWTDTCKIIEESVVINELNLCFFSVGDINTRTNVAYKSSDAIKPWHSMIIDPTIFTGVVFEAIFHAEWFTLIKIANINFQTPRKVFGMYSLSPAITHFLLKRSAGKI